MWRYWLIGAVAFFILEVITPFFFFFSLGVASVLVVFVDLFITHNPTIQSVVFLVLSSLFVVLSRKFYKKIVAKTPDVSFGVDALIGKSGKVVSVKEEGRFIVKVNGQEWLAFCDDKNLKVGDEVLINNVEGTHLLVSKK